MQALREQKGNTVNIYTLRIMDASGNVLIGATVLLSILRHSDGFWLDWNDLTFKASGWATRQKSMTELDAVQLESQGVYWFSWTVPTDSDNEYLPFIYCAAAGNPVQQGSVIAGSWVENMDASINDVKRIVNNKLTIDESGSNLLLWNDAGTAIITTWPLTDKDGSAIVLQGTGPANRGSPT